MPCRGNSGSPTDVGTSANGGDEALSLAGYQAQWFGNSIGAI
jgi:hypothetical protein